MYKLRDNVYYRSSEKECILIDLNSDNYYELNEVSFFILSEIDNGLNETQIATQVSKKFDIDFSTALKDCISFIECLKEKSIVIYFEV